MDLQTLAQYGQTPAGKEKLLYATDRFADVAAKLGEFKVTTPMPPDYGTIMVEIQKTVEWENLISGTEDFAVEMARVDPYLFLMFFSLAVRDVEKSYGPFIAMAYFIYPCKKLDQTYPQLRGRNFFDDWGDQAKQWFQDHFTTKVEVEERAEIEEPLNVRNVREAFSEPLQNMWLGLLAECDHWSVPVATSGSDEIHALLYDCLEAIEKIKLMPGFLQEATLDYRTENPHLYTGRKPA